MTFGEFCLRDTAGSPERARWLHLARSRSQPYNKTGYWPSSFFCLFMDRDEVEVHKLAKKRARPISSHPDRTNLVNRGFIIWLLVKFCLPDTAGSPERARWLHLARSGSQSQRAIWFILPAHKATHIITRSYNSYRLSSLGSYYTLSVCGLLLTHHKVFFFIYFFILPSAFCSMT